MSKTLVIELPDHANLSILERDIWEALEPGASQHCRQILWDSQGIIGSHHVRLDVTIKEVR